MASPINKATHGNKVPLPIESGKYDFDPELLAPWVEKTCIFENSETIKAICSVAKCIHRIPFKAFSDSLGKVIASLPKNLAGSAKVLISAHKSNQWVAELANTRFNFSSAYLPLGQANASDYVAYLNSLPLKDRPPQEVVLFDDASYSGNQMTNHVNAIKAKMMEKGTPCTIHVVVPYITSVALKRLQSIAVTATVKISIHHVEKILTIKEQLPPKDFEIINKYFTDVLNVKLSEHDQDSGIAGSYFDHKIPNQDSFIFGAFGRETMPSISPPYTRKPSKAAV